MWVAAPFHTRLDYEGDFHSLFLSNTKFITWKGKKMALKLKSPQRQLAVHEICPLWATGQVAEPVKTQEAAQGLS